MRGAWSAVLGLESDLGICKRETHCASFGVIERD